MAKASLQLRSFGVTALSNGEGESFVGLGAKALGLLVFIVTRAPTAVSREELVELLWERVDPVQGKGSLRQEIRRIKKVLGADLFDRAFDVTERYMAFRADVLDFDVDRLESVADAHNPEKLAEILEICRGDFLADNSARSSGFQLWAAERRQYYQDLIVGAMTRLGVADLQAGRVERSRRAADKIITIDPMHEQGHEVIIRTLLATGSRGQARNHYERFRRDVLAEHGDEPGFQLSDLDAPDGPRVTTPAEVESPINKKQPVIAVMNVSQGDNQEQVYLAAGVVEELVSNMSRSSWIKVAALDSMVTPREGDVDFMARNLRGYADYVLRVKVLVAGKRASVIATLNRLSDNATLFSDSMEEAIDDLLKLQRRTAMRIASIFEDKIVGDQTEQAVSEPDAVEDANLSYRQLKIKAHSLVLRQEQGDGKQARKLLSKVLEIEPDDAPSLCMLSFSHILDASNGWTSNVAKSIRLAQGAAELAVQHNPDHGWAHFTLGVALGTHDQLDAAFARVSHALRLNPGLIVAQGDLARLHVFKGECEPAVDLANQALENSPYHQNAALWIRVKALASWLQGDLEEALSLIDYAIIVRNSWFQNHYLRGVILAEMGRIDEGSIAFVSGQTTNPNYSDEALRYRHPFSDPANYARFVRGLNMVGGRFQE